MNDVLFLFYKNIIKNYISSEYADLIYIDPPKTKKFGDFSTNISMVLSKKIGKSSMEIAKGICEKLQKHDVFSNVQVKNPGFVNWFIPRKILLGHIPAILNENFGHIDLGCGKRVNIEYVSANPTGPIHAGHTRGAISGDVLANLMKFAGYDVTKEFYINDAGAQIEFLAKSLYFRYLQQFDDSITNDVLPNWAYPGEYLIDTAKKIVELHRDGFVKKEEVEWLPFFKDFAIADMMAGVKEDLNELGVKHDIFISEKEFIRSGAIEKAIDFLKKQGLIYRGVLEKPKGANSDDWEAREQLLFKSTEFGDDVDRPLQKIDGTWTYFASDIAYHMDKISRGYDEIINFWGADHAGYVKRMQSVVSALSNKTKTLHVKLVQLVRLMENGKEMKMSKRTGNFITARGIIEKVGKDVIRFIMLTRRDDAPLDFDFKKIIEHNRENSVFYVQYAYARINSVFKTFKQEFNTELPNINDVNLDLLDEEDLILLKILADWPRQVFMAVRNYEPHRIVFYLDDVAFEFHSLWNKGKENTLLRFVTADDYEKSCTKIILLLAVHNVIRSVLNIIGIQPVEELR